MGLLAGAAHAGGPVRGGAFLGSPVFGVFPTAPAAIAPSFRNSTFQRTFFFGPPRVVAGVGLPVWVGPPGFYDPTAYAAPPVPYAAPPVVYAAAPQPLAAAPPPPPPERDVIEYSDGRYELRGDGVGAPYRWVWIPKPPPAPAAKPGREVRLYGWTDEHGVVNVTDRLDTVPERYRAEAKRNASS